MGFSRRWLLLLVVAFLVMGFIVGCGGGNNEPALEENTTENSETTNENETNEEVFGDGTYLVGQDISPGLYKAIITDNFSGMGYIERSKDVTMDMDSILANIILTGDGYVEIKESDVAVKLQGVEISTFDLNSQTPNIKNEVSDGIFLVGYDINPGRYKVEVTDQTTGMAYVERAKNVSMDMDDIIANEIFQGQGYVDIKDSDFAVRIQGAKLTLQQ